MNINATLLGQMFTFAILVFVTMRYIWPPVTKALEERQEKIAAGIKAGEQGELALEKAKAHFEESRKAAKEDAAQIVKQAQETASRIVSEAREKAVQEGKRLLAQAQEEIGLERRKAQQSLRQEVSGLVVACTSKLLAQSVDEKASNALVDRFLSELEEA